MEPTPTPSVSPLSVAERAELKRLAEAATRGPWRTDGYSSVLTVAETRPVYDWSRPLGFGKYPLTHFESEPIAHLNDGEYIENPKGQEDAAYIAALSPEVLLALLEENERLSHRLVEAQTERAALLAEFSASIQPADIASCLESHSEPAFGEFLRGMNAVHAQNLRWVRWKAHEFGLPWPLPTVEYGFGFTNEDGTTEPKPAACPGNCTTCSERTQPGAGKEGDRA